MRPRCGRKAINDIRWFAHFPEVNASTSLTLQSELLGVEFLPNFSPFRSPKLIEKIKIQDSCPNPLIRETAARP